MAIPILSRLSYWDYERIILTFLILVAESLLRFFMLFIPYSYFRFFCSLLPVFNKVPHVFKAEENEKSAPALAFLQDAVSMIESHGYLAEEHTAITEDGYFLVCHRVLDPHSVKSNLYKEKNPYFTKKRPVVLLMHGCMMSSEVWFCHENPKKCYPFILSDLGSVLEIIHQL